LHLIVDLAVHAYNHCIADFFYICFHRSTLTLIINPVMTEPKRQVLPTTASLAVVATPIGNLGDVSPRVRQALEEADTVLCEDTRRTAMLLTALGISRRLERLDAHATPARIADVVSRVAAGERFALVTDAGTPGISDPAAALVSAVAAHGAQVVPVPGPSAVTALLSVAGFSETAFCFAGFFPRKDGERKAAVKEALSSRLSRLCVWFDSPERLEDSLAVIAEECPDARVVAAKELTKMYERFFRGTAVEVLTLVSSEFAREGKKGEWCFAVEFPVREVSEESSDWVKALQCLLDVPLTAPEAARRVSQVFGTPKREVYERALRILGKK
jgi:16S rRNA (cytidine1402-2'-O)-methyltransferase